MRCAKDIEATLEAVTLADGLVAHTCSHCEGLWVSQEGYRAWKAKDRPQETASDPHETPAEVDDETKLANLELPRALAVSKGIEYKPSPFDGRAGLCPACGFYLVRSRVNLNSGAFFVERCPSCEGLWCDRGEWPLLKQLGLSHHIPLMFTEPWQVRVRALEAEYRERQATIEKLGPDIAEKLFELAKLLEAHPMGDFGVAYLMRRFEQ